MPATITAPRHDPTTAPPTSSSDRVEAWQQVSKYAAQVHYEAVHVQRVHRVRAASIRLLKALNAVGVSQRSLKPPSALLTKREYQILCGLSDGQSNAAIGQALFVSEDTIKTHTHRLYRKLGARNRAHAVAMAFRAGMLR